MKCCTAALYFNPVIFTVKLSYSVTIFFGFVICHNHKHSLCNSIKFIGFFFFNFYNFISQFCQQSSLWYGDVLTSGMVEAKTLTVRLQLNPKPVANVMLQNNSDWVMNINNS